MKKYFLCVLFCFNVAWGINDIYSFPTQAQHQEFETLTSQLRCLVCQNQTLADSDAPLAHDLRAQVAQMVEAHHSAPQIIQFLTDRYGDFVLYDPPFKPATYILWGAPLVGILLAFLLVIRAKR